MKTVKVSIILMIAIVAVASAAFAAPAQIGFLEQNISDPVRVALDGQGNIYVTEAQRNLVLVYTSKGQFKTSLSVPYPLGVAVAPNGRVYVGSGNFRDSNPVYVFTADFAKAGCLGGASCAGFVKPIDVAVDGKGDIYVVDGDADVSAIKVYDASGALKATITGTGASRLRKPMGAAIDAATGNLYVSDYPVITTANGLTDGARIQVFDQAGNVVTTFGQFGVNMGQITSPNDLALDGKGNLYVTDAFQNLTHIISVDNGSIIGSLDSTIPGFNANGVAISNNGLVYVVMQKGARNKGRVDIYALDGYVTMTAGPSVLGFEARQFTGNPAAQAVSIGNGGSGTLNWTASKDQAWIVLGQEAGTADPKGSAALSVGVDISSLKAGMHSGAVTIASDFGQKETIGVSVNVLNPLILNINKSTLTFAAKKGKTAAGQSMNIGIDNVTTTAGWSAKSDATWLSIVPAAGTATAAAPSVGATVSVNTAGMGVGTYSGAITVSSAGAIGDGSSVMVTLTITSTTKINVKTNISDAKFSVKGPASYSGSGSAWSVEDAPAGDYAVTFETVNGYKNPKAEAKTLAMDSEVSFSGTYMSLSEVASRRNILVANALGVRTKDSVVGVYKNTGALSQTIDLDGENRYGASVAAADVDGDGVDEMIVSAGAKGNNPAIVTVMKADRTQLCSFMPFASANGVRIAAGDVDGNGTAEIIVTPAASNHGHMGSAAVYTYDKTLGKMIEAAASMTIFKKAQALDIAVADTDGDGNAELIAVATTIEGKTAGSVKVLRIDTAKGTGNWKAVATREVSLNGKLIGAAVAGGDVDGDGISDIIVGSAGRTGGILTIIKGDGSQTSIKVFGKHEIAGMTLAAADLDGDGKADIVAAPVLDGEKAKAGSIEVLSANGKSMFTLDGGAIGANVAIGELGL